MKTPFVFREITDRLELEKCFKLRYESFMQSDNSVVIHKNEFGIDVNEYDIHSKHYCLIEGQHILGYFRVIFPRNEIINKDVICIGEKYKQFNYNYQYYSRLTTPYPFLNYEGVPESHLHFYRDLSRKNESILEVGRIFINPKFRSAKLLTGLIECSLMLFCIHGIGRRYAVINCKKTHESFYKRLGFHELCGEGKFLYRGAPSITLCLPLTQSLTRSTIPRKMYDKLVALANEFRESSQLSLS